MTLSSGARNTTQNPSSTHRENHRQVSADSTSATDPTMAQDRDMAGSVAPSRTAAASCAHKLERSHQSTVFTYVDSTSPRFAKGHAKPNSLRI